MSAPRTPRPRRPDRVALATAVAVTALATTLAGFGPDDTSAPVSLPSPAGSQQAISRANLAHLWPLTVEAGTLTCHNRQDALFVAPDGTAYALNDQASQDGYPSIDKISDNGKPLGAMRSLALGLCQRP
jgi:hypothetical protein